MKAFYILALCQKHSMSGEGIRKLKDVQASLLPLGSNCLISFNGEKSFG